MKPMKLYDEFLSTSYNMLTTRVFDALDRNSRDSLTIRLFDALDRQEFSTVGVDTAEIDSRISNHHVAIANSKVSKDDWCLEELVNVKNGKIILRRKTLTEKSVVNVKNGKIILRRKTLTEKSVNWDAAKLIKLVVAERLDRYIADPPVQELGRFGWDFTSWEKGERLGRGSFGSVYEGFTNGGNFIAVKEVSLLDQREKGRESVHQLQQEIDLLSQFKHENIVRYYGTDKDESNLYIFLELVTKGSLLSIYRKYHLSDSQVSAYTRQILHGLMYLHDRNVVHRDIKCANILVQACGSVKLADFGLAKITTLNDVNSCKGSVFWMAPEVVKNQGYGLGADIWSLGCTVLEMMTRQLPYYPLEWIAAMYKIGQSIPPPIPESLSVDARDFILQCLQVNPDARPTAAKLLDHRFVRGRQI